MKVNEISNLTSGVYFDNPYKLIELNKKDGIV